MPQSLRGAAPRTEIEVRIALALADNPLVRLGARRAIALLRDEAGAKFDPRAVEALSRVLDRRSAQSLIAV